MWYVIQVTASHELDMIDKCRKVLKDGEEVFTMMTERFERKDGEWKTYRFVTFRNYIFIDTTDPDDLKIRLHNVIGMTKMLGVGDEIIPIRPEEEEFLKKIGGPDHVIGKASIYCEGDKITITDGPFAGMEGMIKWTDKRQRLVGVKVVFMNRETEIKLGADYIKKE